MTDEQMYRRFAWAEALYRLCTEYHSGQWSRGYRILSRLLRHYKPGLAVQRGEWETEEGEAIYSELREKYADKL